MKGYSSSDVARMLDLPVERIRSFARAGFLKPDRGPRGEYRYTFQDLVLLRTAKGLIAARIPAKKVRRALEQLRRQLPTGRPLTAVQIAARGDRILVRDGRSIWNPESGQTSFDFDFSFDFEVAELAERVAPLAHRAAREALESETERSADAWFEIASELEAADPEHARKAYRRAIELDPQHADAHVNLGRLLHEGQRHDEAASHYRAALEARPGDPTALFNLGVLLEDRGRRREAQEAYEAAIEADPCSADAHYNLARIYEQDRRAADALRHFSAYRRLTAGGR